MFGQVRLDTNVDPQNLQWVPVEHNECVEIWPHSLEDGDVGLSFEDLQSYVSTLNKPIVWIPFGAFSPMIPQVCGDPSLTDEEKQRLLTMIQEILTDPQDVIVVDMGVRPSGLIHWRRIADGIRAFDEDDVYRLVSITTNKHGLRVVSFEMLVSKETGHVTHAWYNGQTHSGEMEKWSGFHPIASDAEAYATVVNFFRERDSDLADYALEVQQ